MYMHQEESLDIVFTVCMIRIYMASLARTKEKKIKKLIWSGFAVWYFLG